MVEPWFVVPVVAGSNPVDHPRVKLGLTRSRVRRDRILYLIVATSNVAFYGK